MKLQRSTVQRSPHQLLRGYKYFPGLGHSGSTWHVQSQTLWFGPFSKHQAELTRQLHGGILVTEFQGKRWLITALKSTWIRSLNGASFKSTWHSRLSPFSHCGEAKHTPLSLCSLFITGIESTSRACLIQQERKSNAWHLLLPLRAPCSLASAVPALTC